MLKKLAELFKKDEWSQLFKVGKKKATKVIEKLKDKGKSDFDKEALEILEFYGLNVAEFKIVRSMEDVYAAAEDIGYPVILKSLASKAVHREDIGATCVVRNKEEIKEAYPQVLGELASWMPWLVLEGVLVQKYIEPEKKIWIKLEREKKKAFPFTASIKDEKKEIIEKIEKNEDFEKLPITEEEYAGIFAFFIHFPEIQKLEADLVTSQNEIFLVDAKAWFFEQ